MTIETSPVLTRLTEIQGPRLVTLCSPKETDIRSQRFALDKQYQTLNNVFIEVFC